MKFTLKADRLYIDYIGSESQMSLGMSETGQESQTGPAHR